jgi:hypothetical protein
VLKTLYKLFLFVALTFVTFTKSYSADSIMLAGADKAKGEGYYYLGYIAPFQGSSLGNGYVSRTWIDYNNYNYSSSNRNIDASVKGVSYTLGYQNKLDNTLTVAGYLGAIFHNTSLSPDDTGNKNRGSDLNPLILAEAEKKLTSFSTFNINGSFEPSADAYWSRIRLGFGNGSLKTGPEFTLQGDPTYESKKIGWFVNGVEMGKDLNFGAKLGFNSTNNGAYTGFIGIEFTKVLK